MNLHVMPLNEETKSLMVTYRVPAAFRRVTFTVPGRPIGYYAVGAQPNWKRMKDYHGYRDIVRALAAQNGLVTPLRCSKDSIVIICTTAYFEDGVHCDPENVRKGIVDALFYTPKGSPLRKGSSDKYCCGAFAEPMYDADNPRVEIDVMASGMKTGEVK